VKVPAGAPKESTFVYRKPPPSGNATNGLGERTKRRARYVFHSNPKTGPLPWDKLNRVFLYCYPTWGFPLFIANRFAQFAYQGDLAPERREVKDPEAMAREVKEKARALGAALVGITELRDELLIEGASFPYRYAISIAIPMNRDIMVKAPLPRAGMEVIRGYKRCARASVGLARFLRAQGFETLAFPLSPSSEVLHVPVAISAGLGQLGKHGSLITREFGSNVRLATVLTSIPLAVDSPRDIGVDDLCLACTVCSRSCPPGAIFDEKQWVRGDLKWYVDFDKCVPYFAETQGCALCIEICPWSEPGKGEWLSEKLLSRRKVTSR
jgi:NAD-dependent dihydropyrimidine dehydrogenase PreA subunit